MSRYYGEHPPYRRDASPSLHNERRRRTTTIPKSPTAFPGSYDDEEPFYGSTEKPHYPDPHLDEHYQSKGYNAASLSSSHPRDEYYHHYSNSFCDRRDYQQQYPAERDDDYFRDPRRSEYDFVDRNVEPQEDDFVSPSRRRQEDERWDREPHQAGSFEKSMHHYSNESYRHDGDDRQYEYEPRRGSFVTPGRPGRPYWDERERQRCQYDEYADEAPYTSTSSRRIYPDSRQTFRDDQDRRSRHHGGFRETPSAPMSYEYLERQEEEYVAQPTSRRVRGRSRSSHREVRRPESPYRYQSRSPTREREYSSAGVVRDEMDQRRRDRVNYYDYQISEDEHTAHEQAYNFRNLPSRDELNVQRGRNGRRKPSLHVEIPTPNGSLPRRNRVLEGQSPGRRTSDYVIAVPADGPRVSFTPSTELPSAAESDEVSEFSGDRTSSSHAERVANAKLLKEQSEARHQILKEVRQAMELRDMAKDPSDKDFWEDQIETLNNDLRQLCNHQEQRKPAAAKPREIHLEASPKTESGKQFEALPIEDATYTVSSNFTAAPTTLKIRAPEALPGGHEFKVKINGKVVKAKVPNGGVQKGDIFLIRLPFDPANKKRNAGPGMVKVRAPASLPEGYRFTAKMGEDRLIVATVPKGGVKKGEIFKVPIVDYKEATQRVSL